MVFFTLIYIICKYDNAICLKFNQKKFNKKIIYFLKQLLYLYLKIINI